MKGNIAVFFLFIVVGMATMEAVKAAEETEKTEMRQTVCLSPPEGRRLLLALKAEVQASKIAEAQTEVRKTEEWHTYLSQTYSQIADFHKTRQIQADWQDSPYFRRKWRRVERHLQRHWRELRSRYKEAAELEAAEREVVDRDIGPLAELFTKKLYFPMYFQGDLEGARERELELELEQEEVRSQDVQERGTGSIWIAAGLSSLATFCVAAIALILLNLKGQRKVGQKEVSLVNNNILGNADTR